MEVGVSFFDFTIFYLALSQLYFFVQPLRPILAIICIILENINKLEKAWRFTYLRDLEKIV